MYKNYVISIIVPTYNCEAYIFQTINSILCQTYQFFEIIVIDDHSTDSTVDIIKSFNDSRIVIIVNEENFGVAYARNVGIKKATGDYIAFLDGDDYWAYDKLEKQLNFMVANNYYFSSSFYFTVNNDGTNIIKINKSPLKMTHRSFLKTCYIGCLTVMYKREIYPDLSIPITIKKRNDYALWLKLTERTDCYCLPEKLAYYRRSDGSLSSSKKRSLFKYHVILFRELYHYHIVKCYYFALRNVFYYFLKQIKYVKNVKSKDSNNE